MAPTDIPVLVTGEDRFEPVEWLAEVWPDGYSELKFRPVNSGATWSPPIPHLLVGHTGSDL